MVERTQVDLEVRDWYVRTALTTAAFNGHLSVVQYLCEQGAAKEARDGSNKSTLHWAAGNGCLPVVQYFEGLNL